MNNKGQRKFLLVYSSIWDGTVIEWPESEEELKEDVATYKRHGYKIILAKEIVDIRDVEIN